MRRSLWILSLTGCLHATGSLSAQMDRPVPGATSAPKLDPASIIAPPASNEGMWRARRDETPIKTAATPALLPVGDWQQIRPNVLARGVAADPIPDIAPTTTQDGWHARRQEITPTGFALRGSQSFGASNSPSNNNSYGTAQPSAPPAPSYFSSPQQAPAQGNSGGPPIPPPYPQPDLQSQGQVVEPQFGPPIVEPPSALMPGMQPSPHQMPPDSRVHPIPSDPEMHQLPSEAHDAPHIPENVGDSGYWTTCEYPRTPRITLSAEAMVWFLKDAPLRDPLVTSSGNPADLGILRQPTTNVLLGDRDYNLDRIYGSRLTADLRICDLWHLEASGFALQESTRNFSAQSLGFGFPVVAVPTFDPNTGSNSSIVLAAPGFNSGGVSTQLTTQFWGAEANVTHHLFSGCQCSVDGLVGLRYLDLEDNFDLVSNSTFLQTPGLFAGVGVPRGSTFGGVDSYNAHNQFYGGQVGARVEMLLGRFTLSADGKIAVGENHETVTTMGGSYLIPAGQGSPSASAVGGLLTGPGNIGRYMHDEITYLPEVGFKVCYYLRPHIQLTAGCDLLYWNSVVRATDQIDPRFNGTQVPFLNNGVRGGGLNAPLFRTSDFWAEGFSLGLSFCY